MSTVTQVSTQNGMVVSGDVTSVVSSDDIAMEILADVPGVDRPAVAIAASGVLSNDSPSSITLSYESQVNTIGVASKVEMFDYENNNFVEIGSSPGSFGMDETSTFNIDSNASDFIQNDTGRFIIRIHWDAEGQTLMFPWRISLDQVSLQAK